MALGGSMKKLNILEIKQNGMVYELYLNGKFECSCEFKQLWYVLEEIKDKKHIDKIAFL